MSKTNISHKSVQTNKSIIKTKISIFLENGRKEITSQKELEKFPIGSLIAYMNNKNEFRNGGFIIKFCDDSFIYINPEFTHKYKVRYKNVQKMWVGNVYKTKNDIVSLVKTSRKKTNFPVVLNNIPIYYAKNNFDVKRFQNTNKYETYIKWIEYFC